MSDARELEIIDVDESMPIEPSRAAQYLLYVIAGFFFFALVWAAVAKLDRVTRGQGRVVTSNQLQEIQYLEGGIVKEILVSAGERVAEGQVLVKLDPTQMNVEFTQGQEGYNQLSARIARLEAEVSLTPVQFSASSEAAAPRIVANERSLYDARQAELDASLSVAVSKYDQRQQALEDAKVVLKTAQEAFRLAEEEHTIMRRLVEKGIEPQVELLRARQREAAALGDLQRGQISVSRSELEAAEAQSEIDRIKKGFSAAAADELNKAKAEFEELKGEMPALQDKVARTEVRSPVDGFVNRVLVSTIGGVVTPGETIVEVVPAEDSLLVEAQIKPADIGFLHIGQPAKVSVSAYDSSLYGSMEGEIETISHDAIKDEQTGEWYYTIKVRTTAETLSSRRGELKILPGMSADVSVLNGKRTVLAYVMKPLSNIGDKALRDK